jgi:murein DD-endopeptidase MepM/ murein hydrolase activator NlpD
MSFDKILHRHKATFASVFQPALASSNTIAIDLSSASTEFSGLGEVDFDQAISSKISNAGAIAAVGGYLENRSVYSKTDLFEHDRERNIHIGVDVFIDAGTGVYAPLEGVVHSFANRQLSGDYGPVIIVQHQLADFEFHTLYGHLSESSLQDLQPGQVVAKAQLLAEVGARPNNGNWPPHLHFQIIIDMQDYQGDYPGVARSDRLEFFKQNCPDPLPLLVA